MLIILLLPFEDLMQCLGQEIALEAIEKRGMFGHLLWRQNGCLSANI